MTNEQAQAERIVKAQQAAELLESNLREAHAKAENVAEEMLLMEVCLSRNDRIGCHWRRRRTKSWDRRR